MMKKKKKRAPIRLKGNVFGACRPVNAFEKLNRIGEGTYGTVYRARNKETKDIVALKKVILHNEKNDGFPVTSIREVMLLKRFKHPNIVSLHEIAVGTKRESVFLVFEYCEHDMATLMESMTRPFSGSEVKCLVTHLLQAVKYLHSNWVLHRDLKMSNLLYNSRGQLKVADFGLARCFSDPPEPLTPKVVTLWYRAPELLFGTSMYSVAVDNWAVGCIFGELLLHRPLMPGNSEAAQVDHVFRLLGCPNDTIWPNHALLPHADKFRLPVDKYTYNRLRETFPDLSSKGLDLLDGLLAYDPSKRTRASSAMQHSYFKESPQAKQPVMMPTFPTLHTAANGRSAATSSANATSSTKSSARNGSSSARKKRRAKPRGTAGWEPGPEAHSKPRYAAFGSKFG